VRARLSLMNRGMLVVAIVALYAYFALSVSPEVSLARGRNFLSNQKVNRDENFFSSWTCMKNKIRKSLIQVIYGIKMKIDRKILIQDINSVITILQETFEHAESSSERLIVMTELDCTLKMKSLIGSRDSHSVIETLSDVVNAKANKNDLISFRKVSAAINNGILPELRGARFVVESMVSFLPSEFNDFYNSFTGEKIAPRKLRVGEIVKNYALKQGNSAQLEISWKKRIRRIRRKYGYELRKCLETL
jgi:hypothetical protein